jgi:Ca2+-binding EF-hand superfamily protein
MFNKIDTNGDGTHDADELAAMVANGPSDAPSVEDILSSFDTDGDGAISESEYNTAQDTLSGASTSLSAADISSEDFIKQLFSESDTDGDGVLSEEELTAMAAKGPEDGPSAEELIGELDTDEDGVISESEFIAGAPAAGEGALGAQAASATSSSEIFDEMDTNEDGYVSQAEWEAAMGGDSTTDGTTSGSDLLNDILANLTSRTDRSSGDSASEKNSTTDIAQFLSAIQSYLQFSFENYDNKGLQGLLGTNLYV